MSSFKRRIPATQKTLPPGTRLLSGSSTTFLTSTGIPSLDDILGGGLPLGCSQVILAPDLHSAYGELTQKYYVAQGLAAAQDVYVVDDEGIRFVEECMWMPGSAASSSSVVEESEKNGGEAGEGQDTKIKIAWRYEQMKQFQTTVSSSNQSDEDFCRVFDLTCRIPAAVIQSASKKQLVVINVSNSNPEERPLKGVLKKLTELLGPEDAEAPVQQPVRICIPALGSAQWGDVLPHDICHFLHTLRSLLRSHSNASASVSLAPHLCVDSWGGPGWIQKLGWLSDACVSLSAFTGNPSLASMFPSHHGFVHIHSLPSPSGLLPASDKFSTLRGLTSSGENNLAFKCMRKRLVFETLHLDLEGGIGERRTTPADTIGDIGLKNMHVHTHEEVPETGAAGGATVEIQMEQLQHKVAQVSMAENVPLGNSTKKVKQKKKVAFTSERPDLYDF